MKLNISTFESQQMLATKTMSGSSSLVGVALFISLVTFIFKRRWTAAALYRAPLRMGHEPVIRRLKLLEIPMPSGDRHNLMRIQNEILINQLVEEGGKAIWISSLLNQLSIVLSILEGIKYVINITNDEEKALKPQSALDYVADVKSLSFSSLLYRIDLFFR